MSKRSRNQIAEAARNPGIHENLPGRWKKEITSKSSTLSSDNCVKAMQ